LTWLNRIFGGKAETRAVTHEDFFGVARSGSAPITHDSASKLAPVFAAIRVPAESIASMPVHVVEKTEDGERKVADHWLTRLLENPNPAMSRMDFFETMISQYELRGNSYCEVVRDGSGQPVALWPIRPGMVHPVRQGSDIVYRVSTSQGMMDAPASKILHFRFGILSTDGILGCDPVQLLAEDLGAAKAARDHASLWFENSAAPSGVLQHPAVLNTEAVDRLRRQFDERYSGAGKTGKTLLLEDGATWNSVAVDPQKSQLIESRNFSIQDVSRIWRVPAHFLSDTSRMAFASATVEAESLVKNTLRPRCVRLEQSINRQLLSPAERERFSVRFNIDALLRGSTSERYANYATGVQNGYISRSEVRRWEDLPHNPELDSFVLTPGATLATDSNNQTGEGEPAKEQTP